MGNYQVSFIEDVTSAPIALPEKSELRQFARSNNESVGVATQILITLIDN